MPLREQHVAWLWRISATNSWPVADTHTPMMAGSNADQPTEALGRQVGEELVVSSWITIDLARIDAFAHCTGDHHWIHVDVERARRERRRSARSRTAY